MWITRRCTSIFLSAIVSQNRLNPIMQRAEIDRSVRRALPVYDNGLKLNVLPTDDSSGLDASLKNRIEQNNPQNAITAHWSVAISPSES